MPDEEPDRALVWRVGESTTQAGRGPAVVATCVRLETQAETRRTRALPSNPENPADLDRFAVVGVCHYVSSGAWVLEAGAFHAGRERSEDGTVTRWFEQRVGLAFVDGAGRIERAGSPSLRISTRPSGEARVRWAALYDFDGDGVDEAALDQYEHHDIYSREDDRGRIFTLHAGAIGEYAPGARIDAAFAYDADGDGRPDFPQPSAFSYSNNSGPSMFAGPITLAHTLPDGSFTQVDAVAREFVRLQCEGYPRQDHWSGTDDSSDVPWQVGCQRFWGVQPGELRRQTRGMYHLSDVEFGQLIETPVPFVLQPPCAAP